MKATDFLLEKGYRLNIVLTRREMPSILLVELLQEYANQSKWISVEDELPEENQTVLWLSVFGRIISDSYQQYTNKPKEWFQINFTHWQPLPNPPTT